MKYFKYIFLSIFLLLFAYTHTYASGIDFSISNTTNISYITGNDYVTVQTKYEREVKNDDYYYPATGEKIFHIPDLPQTKDYEVELERQFKEESLTVKDSSGKNVSYTIEKLDLGEGMYVKVKNFKQTTYSSPYVIYVTYTTHDLVNHVYDWVTIQAPSLPEDISFSQTDKDTNTKTSYSYFLNISVDSNIPTISKIYPSKYTVSKEKQKTTYSFSASERIGKSAYLEFGNSRVFKFELKYKTPKTDNLIPKEYSKALNILSTNIYEISLPRDFGETNQSAKILSIYPTPNRIEKDEEGNIIAQFEVPANEESEINIVGYVWVKGNSLEDTSSIPNPTYSEYLSKIASDSYLNKYTNATKYWEVNDEYIQQEAKNLIGTNTYVLDIIKADYKYVNDKLEYDDSKINEGNDRIGAKAALQGGGSVCMEYADSMIALLRAQGIPARAALGYAGISTLEKTTENNIRHQWLQVWIPEYGWLSIDPTYESPNMKIGQDIDRVVWETFNGDVLSNIRVYSADNLSSIDSLDYTLKVYAVEEEPDITSLKEYSDIQNISNESDSGISNTLNTFVKTTAIGKSLVVVTPILIVLILLILIISLISLTIKKIKKSRK